jgi:hypothetical protein
MKVTLARLEYSVEFKARFELGEKTFGGMNCCGIVVTQRSEQSDLR